MVRQWYLDVGVGSYGQRKQSTTTYGPFATETLANDKLAELLGFRPEGNATGNYFEKLGYVDIYNHPVA